MLGGSAARETMERKFCVGARIVCVGAPLPHVLDERAHPFLAAKLVVNIGQPVRESAAWIELILQQKKDIFLDQEVDAN